MPKGLTQTSQQIAVSFETSAVGLAYTEKRIDLQLNALDEEVFVVTAVKIDVDLADKVPLNLFGADNNRVYGAEVALTKQSRTTLADLGNSTCFATSQAFIGTSEESQAGGDYAVGYSFIENSNDVPTTLEYVDIIATPDFFVGMTNLAATGNQRVTGKIYGYRAKASSAIYAALVQSEVLSS